MVLQVSRENAAALRQDCLRGFRVAEIEIDRSERCEDASIGVRIEAHNEFEVLARQRKLIGLAVKLTELKMTRVAVRVFRQSSKQNGFSFLRIKHLHPDRSQ